MRDDQLSASERARLTSLRASPQPPSELEANTVEMLGRRRILTRKAVLLHPRRVAIHWLVAGMICSFVLGQSIPRPPLSALPQSGSAFLLLLHRPTNVAPLSPDESTAVAAEYGRWARSLGVAFVDGAELDEDTLLVKQTKGAVEAYESGSQGDQVTGYFLLRAENGEAAKRIAETCPHLDYGWIEVRRCVE